MSNAEKSSVSEQSDVTDSITERDRAGRRQFMRHGAAFVAVGGLATASGSAYADDCDRNVGQEKNAEAPGSDSDAGSGADPTGCGRAPKAKITQNQNSVDTDQRVAVKKIKA